MRKTLVGIFTVECHRRSVGGGEIMIGGRMCSVANQPHIYFQHDEHEKAGRHQQHCVALSSDEEAIGEMDRGAFYSGKPTTAR